MSETLFCTACGNAYPAATPFCPQCGTANIHAAVQQQQQPQVGFAPVQQPQVLSSQGFGAPLNSSAPVKSRVTAGILALLLGGLGVHKFYLKKVGLGIIYILFCWTFIPALIAFIEGIIYLVQDDASFSRAQRVSVQATSW